MRFKYYKLQGVQQEFMQMIDLNFYYKYYLKCRCCGNEYGTDSPKDNGWCPICIGKLKSSKFNKKYKEKKS